jgi:hypothetical protein
MGKAKEGSAHNPAGEVRIGIGLIALGADSSRILEGCRDWLEGYLALTFPDFEWAIEKEEWDFEWGDSLWLMDRIQERMEENDWQFSFLISDVRGYGHAFGTAGTMSFSHSAAIIYLPDLFPAADKPEEELTVIRCCHLILAYFARLNGLPHLEERRINALDLDKADPLDEEELKELDAALQSMADGILRKGYKEIKGAALYARIIFSHPMRVLRTVRSHRPFRMVFSLGKLVFAAMAALVLALLSTELWYLGVGINTWRLIIIAVAVLLASTLYVVFRQRLYVRRVSRSLSEQAAFFNLTSFLTVFSVLLALFTIIFVVTIVVTVGVYPRYIIEDWLGKSDVGFLDYAKVSLLISSMAMVVGALGAGLEENQHFRQVMYTERNR